MKNLTLIFVLVFFPKSVIAQTDSTKTKRIFPVYVEGGGFNIPAILGLPTISDFGLGYRFNKNFGLGFFYSRFGIPSNGESTGELAEGVGIKLRFTPGSYILLEGGVGIVTWTDYNHGDGLEVSAWDKNKSNKFFYNLGVSYRFGKICYIGLDVSYTYGQFFKTHSYYDMNHIMTFNETIAIGGFSVLTFGITLPQYQRRNISKKRITNKN